jgi:branched-chain amino acid transport system substrate-binding protein
MLKALFATKNTESVLGTFGFNKDGDTTLKSYGLYKVGVDGAPVYFETLTPTKTVS